MAMCTKLDCTECGFSIEVWGDGNPYEIHDGIRIYVYHPSDLSNCVGNAPNHICRDCEYISMINPDEDEMKCHKCSSENIISVFKLENNKCIRCDGILEADENFFKIS